MAGVSVDKKDLGEFTDFLLYAKSQTYGGVGKKTVLPDGTRRFEPVTRDLWRYEDEYVRGNSRFGGVARAFYDDILFWNMFYHGGMTPDFRNNQEVINKTFAFLKSLLQNDGQSLFRGPPTRRDGDFEYFNNTVEGDISYYKGEEEIWLKTDQVYVLRFIGGCIE